MLDLDMKKSLKLNDNVEIIPTRMLQREIEHNQSVSDEIELDDDIVINPAPSLPKKRGRGRPSTKNTNPPIKTEGATTSVIPAKPYKLEKEVREQLSEVIQYASRLMDMGVDYGLGVDTSDVSIWELTPEESEVFVRILERRAARSETVRDKVIPKLLEGRDYMEAGMIVMPRAFATVQNIVDNGGIKPHIVHKKE